MAGLSQAIGELLIDVGTWVSAAAPLPQTRAGPGCRLLVRASSTVG
jgi:hypothetical protein